LARPSTRTYREIPVTVFNDWDTVGLVKDALHQHEMGLFQASAYLVEAMGRDPRVAGIMQARIDGLMSKPMVFEPRNAKSRRGQKVAEQVQTDWAEMADETELKQLLKWGLMLGVGVAQKIWTTIDGEWRPRLEVWHPSFLFWDWAKRSYQLNTMDGLAEIPQGGDSTWLVYTPYGYNRGWMEGKVRALAIPWLMRGWAMRDWARFDEQFALGLIKAFMPMGTNDADRARFSSGIANRNESPVIECPFDPAQGKDAGFDVELVDTGSAAGAWQVIPGLADRCETDMAIVLIGQNLTTEVKGGSRAAAEVHDSVKQELVKSDSNTLGRTLQKQLLQPWAAFNYGKPELAPLPVWQVEPPQDKDRLASALQKLGAFLTAAKAAGAPVDVRRLLEEQEVPTLSLEEEAAQAAKKAAEAPDPEDPTDPEGNPGGEDPEQQQLSARSGTQKGQRYADRVAENAVKQGARAVHLDLAAVISEAFMAGSFDEVKARLLKLYPKMDEAELATEIERACLLAEQAGRVDAQRG